MIYDIRKKYHVFFYKSLKAFPFVKNNIENLLERNFFSMIWENSSLSDKQSTFMVLCDNIFEQHVHKKIIFLKPKPFFSTKNNP